MTGRVAGDDLVEGQGVEVGEVGQAGRSPSPRSSRPRARAGCCGRGSAPRPRPWACCSSRRRPRARPASRCRRAPIRSRPPCPRGSRGATSRPTSEKKKIPTTTKAMPGDLQDGEGRLDLPAEGHGQAAHHARGGRSRPPPPAAGARTATRGSGRGARPRARPTRRSGAGRRRGRWRSPRPGWRWRRCPRRRSAATRRGRPRPRRRSGAGRRTRRRRSAASRRARRR